MADYVPTNTSIINNTLTDSTVYTHTSTSTGMGGSYCHNCGRGPMSSYTLINGLVTCDWCLPENQKKDKFNE